MKGSSLNMGTKPTGHRGPDVASALDALKQVEEEFGRVDDGHPFVAHAQLALSWALQEEGRYEDAIEYAKLADENFGVNYLGLTGEHAEARLAEESALRRLKRQKRGMHVAPGVRVEPGSQPERMRLATLSIESLCAAFDRHIPDLEHYHAARLQSAIGILNATARDPAGANPVIAEQAVAQGIATLLDAGVEVPMWMAPASKLGANDDSEDGAAISHIFNEAIRSVPARDRALIEHSVEATEEASPSQPPVDATSFLSDARRAARDGTLDGVKDFQKTLIGKVFPGALGAMIAGVIGYWSLVSEVAESLLRFLVSIFSSI